MTRSRISFPRASAFEEPTVNLTPLIDVVFVILIMFIIIAPLMELDNIELAEGPSLSPQGMQSVKEQSPISIYVAQDNTVRLNNEVVDVVLLPELLKQSKKKFPRAIPQIFHDRRAQFGTYQAVKNAAEAAGFANLEIILKPA